MKKRSLYETGSAFSFVQQPQPQLFPQPQPLSQPQPLLQPQPQLFPQPQPLKPPQPRSRTITMMIHQLLLKPLLHILLPPAKDPAGPPDLHVRRISAQSIVCGSPKEVRIPVGAAIGRPPEAAASDFVIASQFANWRGNPFSSVHR